MKPSELILDRCSYTSLLTLPDGMEVRGDLYIGNQSEISKVPNGLKVQGNLRISSSRDLEIPNGVKIKGKLDLLGSEYLSELPEILSVGGELIVAYCSSLKRLPPSIKVGGGIRDIEESGITWSYLHKWRYENALYHKNLREGGE